MSKSVITSSSSLFTTPVPLETKPPRECIVVTVSKSEDGESLVERKSIEKEMRKIIQLNFEEASLSSLVEHGIDPHSLDMVEVSKLGIDRDFDQLASIIEANPDRFFIRESKSEE